ncbi:sugar kinase [Sphaerisporangium melleum]|uniref:Sugar kinase n=1 Tax=Sphaerisporangium melleum TaxID=321316 RepID=A0A917VJL5_9ACTN|nr:ROK family protein [Sphaerisporangium melleum]GGK90705.1 sugar kinase [Sphaerisporangium melleum]GII72830.1 sugar kinase [Sphaerisporangium melleum]
MTSHVLAADIGGTKLAAALVGKDGTVLRRAEVPTPAAPPGRPGVVADALTGLLREVAGEEPPLAVGVASAGPLDPQAGTVSPVNIPAWRDYPVLARVADAVPGAPCHLFGDAVAAAAGEHWRGAGREAGAMLGIVVSTGVGGGLVLDGVPYTGPTGNAGHIGHIVVDPGGARCPCGATGCVETIASGPSMVRWATGNGWRGADARELAQAAAAGEPVALAAFDRAAEGLAAGIVAVATICDLDLVVVGGGVSAAGEVLFAPLRKAVAGQASLEYVRRLRVVPAALGRDAGLVGAARMALPPS